LVSGWVHGFTAAAAGFFGALLLLQPKTAKDNKI
jgi:hypothetical protein